MQFAMAVTTQSHVLSLNEHPDGRQRFGYWQLKSHDVRI
jgi:hypothetical protein